MRKLALGLMLLCVFTLAACGESSAAATPTNTTAPVPTTAPAATPTTAGGGAATISMGQFSFTHGSVTIKAGQSVTFDDPSASGGIHDIVTGTMGKFTAAAGAPADFAAAAGVTFSPGDSHTYKFATAGTYSFTCTIHPSMHAVVTVTP